MTQYLKFPSESVAISNLSQWRVNGNWVYDTVDGSDIDIINPLLSPTGRTISSIDGPIPEYATVSGFHVNVYGKVLPNMGAFEIFPLTPSRAAANT